MRLIAGLTLVLGPFLTLVLFKPGKRGLKFDMWLVAIIQTTVICSSTWIIYNERPYAIVFADYYFRPLTRYQVLDSRVTREKLDNICKTTPCLIHCNLPTDSDELNQIRKIALQSGTSIHMFGEYYKAFSSESISTIKENNLDLTNILIDDVINRKTSIQTREKIIAYQKFSGRLLFFPISSRYRENIAVFDPSSFSIIDTISHDVRSYQ